jgi:Tfp pilus assembly protein PilN
MTLICVVGMGMLVVSQHYFTQRLIELNQQRNLLLRMGQDLLQMRRHEKDFLMRHQQEYFQLFIERSESFSTRLNQLTPLISDFDLPL